VDTGCWQVEYNYCVVSKLHMISTW
jgi:hypothetical protein